MSMPGFAAPLAALAALAIAHGAAAQNPAADTRPAASRPASSPSPRAGGAAPSEDAFKMGSPAGLAEGTTQEEMWPAATEEQWSRPVLVHWQRTFDDALKVARAKNQPILVAVNMDGEIASEHYAGIRYREPATAELMSRYCCIVASVYRHTPRDYDEQGKRVPCPRLGTVTCGEHIEAERELYTKYFDGKRISPRHIVLTLEGKKQMDVYFSWDTATVFTTFRKGVENMPLPLTPHEGTLRDLVLSNDVEDRERLERQYEKGDRDAKRAILASILEHPAVDQPEVLRSAIYSLDLDLAAMARRALARTSGEASLDVIAAALQIPMDAAERTMLLENVSKMAKGSPRARTLSAVHSGLSLTSGQFDADVLAGEYRKNSLPYDAVERASEAAASRPGDSALTAEVAAGLLTRAQELSDRRLAKALYKDVRAGALEAERRGGKSPTLDAVVAVASAELDDGEMARNRALAAITAGLLKLDVKTEGKPDGADYFSDRSRAQLLLLFAEARQRSIRAAFRAGDAWPPEWLSDVNAAYTALAKQQNADPAAFVNYYDFLQWVGAAGRANTVLDESLTRFPNSALVHDRHRTRLLWKGGADVLERDYTDRLKKADAAADGNQLTWFAGYASLVAAEQRRRRGDRDGALSSYEHAIAHFQRNAELYPEGRDNCQHFVALAQAGEARVALERGDLDGAARAIDKSFEARADSAASLDGLGISPILTARMVKTRFAAAGNEERAAAVQASIDRLDPKILAQADIDSGEPQPRAAGGRRRPGPASRPGGR